MSATTATAPVGPAPEELTAAQAHVLAAQSANPSYAGHHVGQYIELVGPLDAAALEEALGLTLDEAPWLRFRLTLDDGRYGQSPVALRPAGRSLPRLDTSEAADPIAAALDLVRERLACPPRLDLLLDPPAPENTPDLFGAALVTLGTEHHLLVQYFHQLAVDGYGVSLLSRRVSEHYTALVTGSRPPASPFAPVSVLARAERAYLGSAAYATDLEAWSRRHPAPPVPVRPTGREAAPSDTTVRATVLLGPAESAAVTATARLAGGTWGEAVLAACAAHLAPYADGGETPMALYTTARTAPGTLRVPGTAVNILPARLTAGPHDTFRDLLRQASAELDFLRRHQRVRGEVLARHIWPGLSGRRVPGLLVNLRPFESELDFGGTTGHVVSLASGPVDDLSVAASCRPDGRLRLDVDGNPALYDAGSLDEHARGFAATLTALGRDPDRPARPAAPSTAGSTPVPARRPTPPTDAEAGPLALLPSAHRLRATDGPVDCAHEAVLLSVPAGLGTAPLRRALAGLARRHPALRLALHRSNGIWSQEVRPASAAPACTEADTLRRVPVAGVPAGERDRLVEAALHRAAEELDPGRARVLRAVWFDAGPREPGLLLLVAHLLSVDGVGWQTLTDELPLLHGESPTAPPGPAGGLSVWVARLGAEAGSGSRIAELTHWAQLTRSPAGRSWPAGGPGHRVVTRLELPTPVERSDGAPHAFDVLLLAALARTAHSRPRLHDGSGLVVELELPRPAHAPRTAGRLSTVHTVRLPLPPGPTSGAEAYDRTVLTLGAVPGLGRGLEQLRHLNTQTAALLAGLSRRGVHYQRRAALRPSAGDGRWAPADGALWPATYAADPSGGGLPLSGPLRLVVQSAAGGDGQSLLTLHWHWSDALFSAAEARALSEEATATARESARSERAGTYPEPGFAATFHETTPTTDGAPGAATHL
ncbi:condensation domain-containing protein [Streptomyces sp. NPDC017949]|uniref:condensation domain-containing protein n=1 Tax=Streptomyces sp. NPDC017949 TaxID=3365020 RepID=UPI00379545D2